MTASGWITMSLATVFSFSPVSRSIFLLVLLTSNNCSALLRAFVNAMHKILTRFQNVRGDATIATLKNRQT
jgi:hypothetical protein